MGLVVESLLVFNNNVGHFTILARITSANLLQSTMIMVGYPYLGHLVHMRGTNPPTFAFGTHCSIDNQ